MKARYSQYVVITAAITVVTVIVLLLLYRNLSFSSLIEQETRTNVDLTRVFHNSIWPKHMEFLGKASKLPVEKLRASPQTALLHQEVVRMMAGSNVVKVKIYDLDGVTVFSSDPMQIGQVAKNNEGFKHAFAGEVISNMTFRDQFDAFENVIVDRNIISSYIPIRLDESEEVEGVFEVYSDVTELVAQLSDTQTKIILITLGSLSGLILLLVFISRRADKTKKEYQQAQDTHKKDLHYQSSHDELTGLLNRNSFNESLDEAIVRASHAEAMIGVLVLGLDGFKLVNEGLGHEKGDELLRITAKRIAFCLNKTDMLFRLGGDEFCIIKENMVDIEDAARLAKNIQDTITNPIDLANQKVLITISIGIALYPKDDTKGGELFNDAKASMGAAKKLGRNLFRYYTYEMNERAAEQLKFETDLKQALNKKEFELYYQPRVSCDKQPQILGAEALIRWRNQYDEMVLPDQFILTLERTGLIDSVGQWVLFEACRQNKAWQDAGHPHIRVSVNVSSIQFKSGTLVATVRKALKDSGLEPQYLELELTENVLVDDGDGSSKILTDLKSLGIFIAIDDFGTGYSSLSYLKSFPIDFLKIDRAFIKDLPVNKKDVAITSAIISMAHNLDIELVAEGVDSIECVEFLRELGCQELQGFLFSRPIPADEFITYMQEHKPMGAD